MLDFSVTFLINILNIAVLYLILKFTLFKPVTQFMENRAKKIRDDIESAARDKEEAEKLIRNQNRLTEKAEEEAKKIISEAKTKAEKDYNAIIRNAKLEADNMLKKGRDQLEEEKRLMISEAKAEITGIALAAASKVIEINMDTEANRKLVYEFIDRAGVA